MFIVSLSLVFQKHFDDSITDKKHGINTNTRYRNNRANGNSKWAKRNHRFLLTEQAMPDQRIRLL